MIKFIIYLLTTIVSVLFIISCNLNSFEPIKDKYIIEIKPAKWLNNNKSALTITYDTVYNRQPKIQEAVSEVIKRNLAMDFGIVTSFYEPPSMQLLIKELVELYPKGIKCFGHGPKHNKYDNLDYKYYLKSFKNCYYLMKKWNLNPRTYAYPSSIGRKKETQKANKEAGFIAARGALERSESEKFYICEGNIKKPENWYYLPAVIMGKSKYTNTSCFTHQDLLPYVKENIKRGSWIILMYHSIGLPKGLAYYPMEEFKKDLDYFKNSKQWIGNMDDVVCYIFSRNNFKYKITKSNNEKWDYYVELSDGFNNKIYNQELTLNFAINSKIKVKSIEFELSKNNIKTFELKDNKVAINILPDEKTRGVKLNLK